ncbi:unnamed protein product [Closterium sp. NIES-65]|nr:unnamed protein product [Closterium sp. NIES-65]CAI5984269.1 unnamed protein product [Closterium sp. NIES-65]
MAAAALSPMVPVSEAFAITVPKQVGAFLPKSEDGEFVVFTPGMKDTPALRAGNVSPYTFNIPPTWTQSRIANILSGNYCQPKCAEPWIEVKFEDPREGLLQVVASPMVRLTNKLELPIEEIGTPERIIAALGPFVTGDSYDPDEVVDTRIRKEGGQTSDWRGEEVCIPERIIAAQGPLVTGDSYDPDEVVDSRIRKAGG